jgi:hypothetical protein
VSLAGNGVDLLLMSGGDPGLSVEVLAQDVRVSDVPGGVVQDVDHDAE